MGGMIDIHGYSRRLESARLRLAGLDNGELLLAFIDHLEALGLSKGRLAKYQTYLERISSSLPNSSATAFPFSIKLYSTFGGSF